ncbi:MAG: hypothetical protein OEY86_04485 [Nitrospira sp.]|nr:hypothetical protein [Nitrospira sp.]
MPIVIHMCSHSTWQRLSLYILALFMVLSSSACVHTLDPTDLKKVNEHVVMVNGMGKLIDARSNMPFMDRERGKHIPFWPYDERNIPAADSDPNREYFTGITGSIKNWKGNRSDTCIDKERSRILLFVHGGMNTAKTSIERATQSSKAILDDCTYPIFINWDSSLTSSYIDHLIYLRQGEHLFPDNQITTTLRGSLSSAGTTPFYVAYDLVRGAARLPVVLWGVYKQMIKGHINGERQRKIGCTNDMSLVPVGITQRADILLCKFHENSNNSLAIAQGTDSRDYWFEQFSQINLAFWGGFFQAHAISALVTDTVGTGAWSSMNHRTTVMFNREQDLTNDSPKAEPTGGIAVFMKEFRQFLEANGGKSNWEIVLVGHSMGAIVANQMVRQFGHPLSNESAEPLFDTIVYMAAASSARDYLNTIPPYLKEYGIEHRNNGHEPRVYHLTLNDRAEADEQYTPFNHPGSLLIWIDNYFARPDSLLDHVVGRYANLLRIIHLHDDSILDRVSIKSFNYGDKTKKNNPQTHGDFDEFPFWRPEFWEVRGTKSPFSVERCKRDESKQLQCPRSSQ